MNAGSLSLLFNPFSIFSDSYKLKKIVLHNALLNLQVDEHGNTNYAIWKTDTSSTLSFQLELQQVEFKNVHVLYYDVIRQQDFSFLIEEGTLSGDFGSENFSLSTEGELKNTSIIIENVHYLNEKDCKLFLTLDVNKKEGTYLFKNSTLQLAGLKLEVDGTVIDKEDYLDLNLAIKSPSADLPALLSLLPSNYTSGTNDYDYSGEIKFEGSITGRSGGSYVPVVAFSFVSKNAFLNPKGTPYKLKNLNGKGFFTNKKNKANPVTYLKFENFTATLEGKPLKANVEIENFNKPRLSITAAFEADLKVLSKFFKPDTLEEISGTAIVDATFHGISGEKSTYRSSGNIRFTDVNFRLKQKPVLFSNLNGMLHLQGNDLVVESVEGRAGASDFKLQGSFQNLFAWMFSENQSLDIAATLSSNSIVLDELLAKEKTVGNSQSDTTYRLDFSPKLKCSVEISVAEFKKKKFRASDIKGQINLKNQVLETGNLTFNTVDGNVKMRGSIDDRPADSLQISCQTSINNLDINKLFYEMGNFGQEIVVDKNLRGRITADIDFRSKWSNKLELNDNSILMKSNVTIENGELINLKSLLALSRFLKGADLKTVKFSTLTNTIEIKNRKILIPLMEIKSSAVDITASGEHSFDNFVDYKLRLYLSQIKKKKVRAQNTEFGTIEDDGLGRPMVFLTMKGPASDPKFAWDRQGVEEKITDEIRNETQTIKSIIKQEFSRQEPAVNKKAGKKQEELEIEYEEDGDQ